MRIGGMRPSSTKQWATNQSACWQPLANDHRPLARNPPSTGVATPVGLNAPATTTSGPPAYTSANAGAGSLPRIAGAALPIITVHPTDPSARASSRTTAMWSASSSSAPPNRRGTSIRKHPASRSWATRSSGSRRPCSISSPRAAMAGSRARTESRIVTASAGELTDAGVVDGVGRHQVFLSMVGVWMVSSRIDTKASGCSMWGAWAAPSMTCSGQPRRALASSARCKGTIRSCRPHSRSTGTPIEPQLVVGYLLGAGPDQLAHRRLDVADLGPGQGVAGKGGEPLVVAATGGVEVEQGEAVEAFGVACRRPHGEAHGDDSQPDGHPVRPDAGSGVDDQTLEQLAVACGEAGRQAAEQRVGDDDRRLRTGQTEQLGEPARRTWLWSRRAAGADSPSPGTSATTRR